MKKFWHNALPSGILQFAVGFFLLGLVCADIIGGPKKMSIYLIITDSSLFIINVVLGTRNFIQFNKNYDYEERLRFRQEQLEYLERRSLETHNFVVQPEPQPESESRFRHYRKLFLGG